MKILSQLNSRKIKLLSSALFIVLFLAFVLNNFDHINSKENGNTIYHQSQWNEYARQIDVEVIKSELEINSTSTSTPTQNSGEIYGMMLSHHIPTTIPKLVEYYTKLKKYKIVKNFIIIGPDHTDSGENPITVSNASFYTTYGEIRPIDGFAQKLDNLKLANIEEEVFDPEHSVGSQILIISKIFPEAKVTPIILRSDASKEQARALGEFIAKYLDDETVLVASIDFSHYLSTSQATSIDQISGNIIRNLDQESLALVKADSPASVEVFIEAMKQKQAHNVTDFNVLNTNDFMQNSDYTTGYVFGFWGIK